MLYLLSPSRTQCMIEWILSRPGILQSSAIQSATAWRKSANQAADSSQTVVCCRSLHREAHSTLSAQLFSEPDPSSSMSLSCVTFLLNHSIPTSVISSRQKYKAKQHLRWRNLPNCVPSLNITRSISSAAPWRGRFPDSPMQSGKDPSKSCGISLLAI